MKRWVREGFMDNADHGLSLEIQGGISTGQPGKAGIQIGGSVGADKSYDSTQCVQRTEKQSPAEQIGKKTRREQKKRAAENAIIKYSLELCFIYNEEKLRLFFELERHQKDDG